MAINQEATEFGKHQTWKVHYGRGYDVLAKHEQLAPLLEKMDRAGKLGRVLVDAGSGSAAMRDAFYKWHSGLFYTAKGKKIIRIDIGLPVLRRQQDNVMEVRADIEQTGPGTPGRKIKLARIARFLGVKPEEPPQQVDTILLSDVLNYVDFKKTISGLVQYLKPGGRIVVYNKPGRGFSELMHTKGVRENSELLSFLKKSGFEIEHLTPAASNPEFGKVVPVKKDEFISLVARLKPGASKPE